MPTTSSADPIQDLSQSPYRAGWFPNYYLKIRDHSRDPDTCTAWNAGEAEGERVTDLWPEAKYAFVCKVTRDPKIIWAPLNEPKSHWIYGSRLCPTNHPKRSIAGQRGELLGSEHPAKSISMSTDLAHGDQTDRQYATWGIPVKTEKIQKEPILTRRILRTKHRLAHSPFLVNGRVQKGHMVTGGYRSGRADWRRPSLLAAEPWRGSLAGWIRSTTRTTSFWQSCRAFALGLESKR